MNTCKPPTRRNISLLIDMADYEALQALAAATGLSVSEHVRLAVKARLLGPCDRPVVLAMMQAADAHMNQMRAALEAKT